MKHSIAVVMAVSLLMAPCSSAAVKAQELELKAGAVSVSVKTHDGKPLPGAEMTLVKEGSKVKLTITADAKGMCILKDLDAGTYKLVVAGQAMLPFTVSSKAKVDTVVVVLPPPAKYAAGDAKEALAMPSLTTFIIGAVAITTFILIIAGGGGGGGGGHP
ncbi:MAG: prealbumin-like fold domain-containing protein [Planctomycetota bacterium]